MYIKYCEKSEIVYTDWIVLFEVLKKLPFSVLYVWLLFLWYSGTEMRSSL